jgi:hypothetical protein
MNPLLITIGLSVAILLMLLVRASSNKTPIKKPMEPAENIDLSCKHLINLSQMRQALETADREYLYERLGKAAAQGPLKERHRIARRYLEALHDEFVQLMDATQVVASLSPEVEAGHEWNRFKLNLKFELKYRLLKARFALGNVEFAALGNIAVLVSSLAMDLERVVDEMSASTMPTREEDV